MKNLFYSILCLFLTACQSEYHAYDTRIDGQRHIHAKQIPAIETATKGKSSFRFAFITDTQRWYDESEALVNHLNGKDDIDFVIHGGDLTDWGLRAEFELQRDIFRHLKQPYVVLLGNHDCLVTGELIYEEIYGAPDFAFTAGDVRFICLNTNALEYPAGSNVPNFDFLAEELTNYPAEARRTIAVMHAAPLSDQLSGDKAVAFHETLNQFPNLMVCIAGHDHHYKVNDLFEDGMLYIHGASIEKRSYILFTIDEDGYKYEEILF